MSAATKSGLLNHVFATLRAQEGDLRSAGIRHLSLFGSVARGEDAAGSDVDLAAELDPDAGIDLFRLTAMERHLSELLGRQVDLIPEPVEKQRLQAKIERDRLRVF